jgi:sigma-B regulation protein RsbU (phosphoserine phosphatase)
MPDTMFEDDELAFADDNDELLFADNEQEGLFFVAEDSPPKPQPQRDWKVMIVDDEREIHNITKLSLAEFSFDGKPLAFINAYSGREAKQLIQANPDTALILLDVVMESDQAGLDVVKYIREDLKNHFVRIVLRTGQPGQAPEERVIVDYDINDYKAKTELTTQKLFTTVVTALRACRHLETIERLTAEKVRLETELAIARQLQQMLLPTEEELRQIEELDIAGYVEPAPQVSGDYYDVLQHKGQVKIGIGDVSGYGLESGVVTLMAQMGVRTLLTSDETDPTRFLSVLSQTVYANMQRMRADRSLNLALLDYKSGRLTLSGQHDQLIVVRQGGKIETLEKLNNPPNANSDLANFIARASVQLQPGDGVALYTHGIIQAENEAGEPYGLERLYHAISRHWEQPAAAIKQAVIEDVHRFLDPTKIRDDLTLVVVKQK